MPFRLQGEVKLLGSLISEDQLPDFLVIIGENGAGKSCLLEAITSKSVNIFDASEPNKALEKITALKVQEISAGFSSMTPNIRLSPENREGKWAVQKLQEALKTWAPYTTRPDSFIVEEGGQTVAQGQEKEEIQLFSNKFGVPPYDDAIFKSAKNIFSDNIPPEFYDAINTAEKLRAFVDLTPEDALKALSDARYISSAFASHLLLRYQNYYTEYLHNLVLVGKNTLGQIVTETLFDDNEFRDHFGPPPWELLSEALRISGLKYEACEPENDDLRQEMQIKFRDLRSKNIVRLQQMSSGERTLLALAVAQFNGLDENTSVTRSQILLLDEPDAFLHPPYIKKMVDLLREFFVAKLGWKVILTTHSPVLVALAGEDEIAELSRSDTVNLRMVNKKSAVSALSVGLPQLRVGVDNKRHVFVESKADELFLTSVYKQHLHGTPYSRPIKASDENRLELHFIAIGHSRGGGCDNLIRVVDLLEAGGNDSVRGVIDYDTGKNLETQTKLHLGQGERTAMEMYIFDPALIVGLAASVPLKNLRAKLGIVENLGSSAVERMTVQVLEKIIDQLVVIVFGDDTDLEDRTTHRYAGGKEVSVPSAWSATPHKALACKVTEALQAEEPKRNETTKSLQDLICTKSIHNNPTFIPSDIIETIERLERE